MYGNEGGCTQSTTTIATEMGYIKSTGVKTYRFNSDCWGTIETSSGVFDYSKLDAIVAMATGTASNQYGMDLILTMPISASWTPMSETCPQNSPYSGTAVGCTHFPTNDMGLLYRFYNNVATRYGNNILYEVWNEPDNPAFWKAALFPATSDYVLVATTAYAAIHAGAPTAEVLLGPIAFPRGSSLTGSTTHYAQHHYYGELISNSGFTLSNFTPTFHVYYDAEGGALGMTEAISSMTAITKANGGTPTFIIDETNKFGGSYTTSDHNGEEIGKSSWTLRAFSIALSTNVGNGAIIKRMVFHDLKGLDFSALDTSYGARYCYTTYSDLVNGLIGYTPKGDQGSGNTHIYWFKNGGLSKYVVWDELGSGTWDVSPRPLTVVKIDDKGNSTTFGGNSFPLSIGSDPAIYSFTSQSFQIRGVTMRSINLQ